MQAMMFTLLQEQHSAQLDAMTAANKAAMEMMMERMNALVTAQVGRKHNPAADKENEPPPANRGKEDSTQKGSTRRKKTLCPHCKTFVYHKPNKCYELEANEDKHWPGWKSIRAITT